MSWLSRLGNVFRPSAIDSALDEEQQFHLDAKTADFVAGGMPPEAARRKALRQFGSPLRTRESSHDIKMNALVDTFVQDVRYAVRACRRNAGFAAAVVVCLAIAIGLNSTLFATLNAVMLRQLPVSHPAQLFLLRPEGPRSAPQFSLPVFQELRDATPGPSSLAAMSRVARMYAVLDDNHSRQPVGLQLVTGEYFSLLGVSAGLGRLIAPADNLTPGGHPIAVISDAFWRRRLAGDPHVLGRGFTVNDTYFTVVGVAAAPFTGVWLESPVDVWVPAVMQADVKYAQNYYNNGGDNALPFARQREIRWLEVIGREQKGGTARPGLTVAFQASLQRDAETIGDEERRRLFLRQTLAFDSFGHGFSNLRGRFGLPLYVLLGMAIAILLVTCANTASLLLARSDARRREMAIRLAIGAGRGRLIRQLLTESALLVLAAGAMGLLFANWAGNVLVRRALATTGPLPFAATMDAPVLIFTMATAVAAVVLFGLAPARQSTRMDLTSALRSTVPHLRSAASLQRLLVVAQVALAVVLLVGAGLLVGSFRNYLHVDLGFEPEHVVTGWINPRSSGFQEDRLDALYRDLVAAVEAVPGVRSASVASCGLAVGCENASNVSIDGYEPPPGEQARLQENGVGSRYFETVGMEIVEGRGFNERDRASAPKVAILNREAVRRYFGGESPLGRTFGDGRGTFEVVGVVEDARVNRVQEAVPAMAYYPIGQIERFAGSVEVRAAGDPSTVTPAIQRALSDVDPRLPVDRVSLLSRQVELNLTQPRLVAELASLFGAVAMALTAFGLFAVMSYVVSRRTPELGIRMALGASRSRVGRAVLRDVLTLTAIGLAAGIPAAIAIARVLGSLLFGVTPANSVVIVAAAAIVLGVAVLAGFVPAWRAARVDPLVALRTE